MYAGEFHRRSAIRLAISLPMALFSVRAEDVSTRRGLLGITAASIMQTQACRPLALLARCSIRCCPAQQRTDGALPRLPPFPRAAFFRALRAGAGGAYSIFAGTAQRHRQRAGIER